MHLLTHTNKRMLPHSQVVPAAACDSHAAAAIDDTIDVEGSRCC